MPERYIFDYLDDNAKRWPDRAALVCEDRSLSWAELSAESRRLAAGLTQALPGEQQKIVGLLLPNGWGFVLSYLAILRAGHIALPIDVIYKPLEINAIISQMQPVAVITDSQNTSRAADCKNLILFNELSDRASEAKLPPLVLPPDKQIASLVFTSGTTGTPKSAPYTHAGHMWNIKVCSAAWNWGHDDTILLSLRLSHWYGLCMGLAGAIYHGNTLYLDEAFEPQATLKKLEQLKISHFTHTPAAYDRLLEVEGDYDLSNLRLPVSGSSALAPSIWRQFKDRFGLEIIECYGSSETGRIASNTDADRQAGSPGALLPDVEAKLSGSGELLIKSPGLFPGYYKNQEATRASLTNDGFWRTGDTAEIIDGRVKLKGRVSEGIRKQSYSVSPRDVEWALRENNQINDCAVIGQSRPGQDSKIVYFIVGSLSREELDIYMKQHLPSVWRADSVFFLDTIPRTLNGKPSLPALRAIMEGNK